MVGYMINNQSNIHNNEQNNLKINEVSIEHNRNKNRNIRNKHKMNTNKDLFMIISVILSSIINIEFILPFWIKLGYSKNIFIQTIFITLISLVIYILFNFLINNEKISIHANNFIVIYILFLIAITFFKARTNNMSFIFNPFDSIYNLKYEILSPLINIVGNLLMYIPIGIYIKFKFNKNITTMTVIFIIYILLVELTQGITKTGIFDANDIIMNTLGFIIGMKLISKY